MFKVMKQVSDSTGTHRWQDAGTERFATPEEAVRLLGEFCTNVALEDAQP